MWRRRGAARALPVVRAHRCGADAGGDRTLAIAGHDFSVDAIVTTEEVIRCPPSRRPHGILWDNLNLSGETIAAISLLAARLTMVDTWPEGQDAVDAQVVADLRRYGALAGARSCAAPLIAKLRLPEVSCRPVIVSRAGLCLSRW